MRTVVLVAVGLGVATALPIPLAHACQFPPCAPDYFLPYGGSVPANVANIQWRPGRSYGGVVTPESALMFRCVSVANDTRDVTFHVEGDGEVRMIVPDEALIVGDSCQITVANSDCDASGWGAGTPAPDYLLSSATFTVVDDAAMPTSLGELRATHATVQDIQVAFFQGCSAKAVEACGVPIELDLDAGAAAWRDLLVFETWVDGDVWNVERRAGFLNDPGGSFVGRGRDLIFAGTDNIDGTDPGAAPGAHTVVMRATLPGTDVMFESAPIEINLDCAGPKPKPSTCSVGRPRATDSFPWLSSLLAIAVLTVRRERARGRSAPRGRASRTACG